MTELNTPVEGVKTYSNPWEASFYEVPESEAQTSRFPGWSSQEVAEWVKASEWARQESDAVEAWAQYELAVEEKDAELEKQYDEALAKFQELSGPVAVGGVVER